MTMMLRPSSRLIGPTPMLGLVLGIGLAASALPVLAQDERSDAAPKGDIGGRGGPARGDPAARGEPAKSDAKGDPDGTSRRLSRLEEQFVDIQVSLGTLESLVKTGAAPVGAIGEAAPSKVASGDPDAGARLQALETQVSALTAQIEQLSRQMSDGGGRGRSGSAGEWVPQEQNYAPTDGLRSKNPSWRSDKGATTSDRDVRSGDAAATGQSGDATSSMAGRQTRFGQAAAGPSGDVPFSVGESPYAAQSGDRQSVVATAESDAKSLYAEAYGSLLKRDYGEAESGFRQLLASYPNDAMAGNAQYWLGETHYARGDYKASADAFLKGYRDRPKSEKAPDSLLKLGMSLAKLGQKDAACSTLGALKTKFPAAPDGLKERAEAEKKRAAC